MDVIKHGTSQLYTRTPEDVKEAINHARLGESNLTSMTQSFYFPLNSENEHFRLLELNKHLDKCIRDGDTLMFKGSLNEMVVLCSEEKTFDVKGTGISNSLLLVSDLKFAAQTSTSPLKSSKLEANETYEHSNNQSDGEALNERICEQKKIIQVFNEYFECREIKPRFRKLRDLLIITSYSGPENEYIVDKKLLYTYNQLLDVMQCSKREFEGGLKQVRAIEINGFMRALDYNYEYRIISLLMNMISKYSWSLNNVDKDETISAFDGIVPKQVIEGVFRIYAKPSSNGKYVLKQDLVARIVALNILKPGLNFRLEEFMSAWQSALVEDNQIETKEEYLRGIGIIDLDSKPPSVKSLMEENLTTNIDKRIDLLFKTKARWTLAEIEPYLEYFTTPTITVPALLTKHTRTFMKDGLPCYVAKHGN